MFKSVFTKYIAFISLLMTFSIALLALTVSSMLMSYDSKTDETNMTNTVDAVTAIMSDYSENGGKPDNNFKEIQSTVSTVVDITKIELYITDSNGNLMLTSDANIGIKVGEKLLSNAAVSEILSKGGSKYEVSTVDGLFSQTQINKIKTVSFDLNKYILLFSMIPKTNTMLSSAMVRTIVVAAVWILIASCMTAYVLFQRVLDPLKTLSDAAKSFAKGDFSKRVYVDGNDEIADTAAAFNNMANVLEKNEELRNSFLGSVSHDLRTPMTIIGGFVDGIRDGTIPEEKRDYYLGIISDEVRRLSRLVNSLLEISRMQTGEKKLNFSKFNISEKARQILISFEKKIDEKKLEIDFNNEEDITVNADADAIHQVLYNLTDNAVKFVNQGGNIKISIENRNKNCVISIRNTGDGIPKEEIPHVFDRFYKSDRSRGLDKNGTGLGLYIAKTNVVMHGGDMTVTSVAGEYTEFTFSLPL